MNTTDPIPLTGSPKQTAWADQIRARLTALPDAYREKLARDKGERDRLPAAADQVEVSASLLRGAEAVACWARAQTSAKKLIDVTESRRRVNLASLAGQSDAEFAESVEEGSLSCEDSLLRSEILSAKGGG